MEYFWKIYFRKESILYNKKMKDIQKSLFIKLVRYK